MNLLVRNVPKNKSLVNNFFSDSLLNESIFNDFLPKSINNIEYDIIESENDYKINLLLAGYNKENFNLDVEDGKLTVTGERSEEDNLNYNFKNSFYGKLTKSFKLPKDVLIDDIDAEYVNGVLMINIPKDKEKINKKSIVIR